MGKIYVILSFLLSFAAPPEGWPSHLQLHNPQENKTEKISSFWIEKKQSAGSWELESVAEIWGRNPLILYMSWLEKKRILALDN